MQPYLPGKPIEELEREYGIKDSIKLASNENPSGPPASAIEAINSVTAELALYPDGSSFALRQALAGHFAIDPASLTLGNGSNDILVLLAESFLAPNIEAVFDQYSFVIYRLAAQAADAVCRIAPSNPADHKQPYGHDLDAFRALLTDKTRLIFIANPNNPTGTWVSADELYEFLQAGAGTCHRRRRRSLRRIRRPRMTIRIRWLGSRNFQISSLRERFQKFMRWQDCESAIRSVTRTSQKF